MKQITGIALIMIFILTWHSAMSQSTIVTDEGTHTSPRSGSVLDVYSTSKGLALPVVTDHSVASPTEGTIVYDDNNQALWFYNGSEWKVFSYSDTDSTANKESSYGEMYENNISSLYSVIDVVVVGQYYSWDSAIEGLMKGPEYVSFVNGTPDRLVIGSKGAGRYRITTYLSFLGNPTVYTGVVFVNESPVEKMEFMRTISNNGDVGSAVVCGFADLAENDYISFRFSSTSPNKQLEVVTLNVNIERID